LKDIAHLNKHTIFHETDNFRFETVFICFYRQLTQKSCLVDLVAKEKDFITQREKLQGFLRLMKMF